MIKGSQQLLNRMEFVSVLQEELVRAKTLPQDDDFEGRSELVGMLQPEDVLLTCVE